MLDTITTDVNGYEIDLRKRGLRVCEQCGLVMSEGFSTDNGDVYACGTRCLELLGVEQSTKDEIEHDDGSAVYWTDWEGDESPDDAIDRLKLAPYHMDTFEVTVQVSFTRTYHVVARGYRHAMDIYQDGGGQYVGDDMLDLQEDYSNALVSMVQ
jgi:hypothetical protein